MDPGRFAACYAALWATHDLGDHVTQTDHQAAGKAQDWRCMAGHVGGYTAGQALALGALHGSGVRLRPLRALAGLALSAASHAFLDRRWPVVALLNATGSDRFARPVVRTVGPSIDGHGRVSNPSGVPREAEATGALPLHGPYLADQALHHVCVALAAAVASGGR